MALPPRPTTHWPTRIIVGLGSGIPTTKPSIVAGTGREVTPGHHPFLTKLVGRISLVMGRKFPVKRHHCNHTPDRWWKEVIRGHPVPKMAWCAGRQLNATSIGLGVILLPNLCTQQKLRGTEWRSSPAKLSRNEKLKRYGRRWLRWFLVVTCFHTAVIRVEHLD